MEMMASREPMESPGSEIPPRVLLQAYARGAFPMAHEGQLLWFSPDPRGIIPIDDFHVPHGLRRAIKDPAWEIRMDTAFDRVLDACAEREETWIDTCIRTSYLRLHALGFAHSVEVWRDGELAGGLYGVRLGGAFFGESMFHRVRDASKVALHALVGGLRRGGFTLLDTQWMTDHLRQFGGLEVQRSVYLRLLRRAVANTDCQLRVGS